jgi:hypothetical protein
LSVELLGVLGAARFVSVLIEVSLWLVAGVPTPVLVLLVSSVISPVSFRAQPAKQISVAAINANFFIFQTPCSVVQRNGWWLPCPQFPLDLHN